MAHMDNSIVQYFHRQGHAFEQDMVVFQNKDYLFEGP